MIDSWMISGAIALVAGISTWAVLKERQTRFQLDMDANESDKNKKISNLYEYIDKHISNDDRLHAQESEAHSAHHINFNERINACFKRVDDLDKRITILERDTATHLTMPKAEEKFVSKAELDLHLKNIELSTKHTEHLVNGMSSKLDGLNRMITHSLSLPAPKGAHNEEHQV